MRYILTRLFGQGCRGILFRGRTSNYKVSDFAWKPSQAVGTSYVPNHSQKRHFGDQPKVTDGENRIHKILTNAFPSAKHIHVEDISGGCGSMYQVFIQAKDFNGLSIVKQHQMVNNALKKEIKEMHGIRISTKPVPET